METLTNLSNETLTSELLELRRVEKDTTHKILLYLNEVEERRLHLEEGYPSLFAYCREKLRYSESGAQRRISAARAVKRYPEVLGYLEEGKVNLSTVSAVAGVLLKENVPDVLERIVGKSQEEVKSIVAEYKPREAVRESIKPVTVVKREVVEAPGLFEKRDSESLRIRSECHENCQKEERYELRLSVSGACRRKLSKVAESLSGKFPRGASLEQMVEVLVDEYLERRKVKKVVAKKECVSEKRTRHIPAGVRREVVKRDRGCCSYVSAEGKRCGSHWDVEVDHIVPFAVGGGSSVENLRLLCRAHNGLAAERNLGREFMDRVVGQRTHG